MKDNLEFEIKGITHQGEGVGKSAEGLSVFVPGVLPGEKVQVKITQKKKNFARGQLIELLLPSPQRIVPRCSLFADCGGCTFQHMEYSLQLETKHQLVVDSLARIGKLNNVKVLPVMGMDNPWNYRNKVHFQIDKIEDKIKLGYYETNSHRFLPLENNDCLLTDRSLNRIVQSIQKLFNKFSISTYDEKEKKGLLRHLMLRKAAETGKIMVVIVTAAGSWNHQKEFAQEVIKFNPQVTSVLRNINTLPKGNVLGEKNILLGGLPYIEDEIDGLRFLVSPNSFYQVNPVQTKKLYNQALQYAALTGKEKVLDAYSGIGTIALFMARQAKEVLGLEVVPQAVKDAKQNATRNEIENVEFYQGEVERMLPLLETEGYQPDVAVLDPPRKGCQKEVLETLVKMKVPRIVYVSCDPGTLARDLSILSESGYEIMEVQPVDMFPQTVHVETVVLMSRKDN